MICTSCGYKGKPKSITKGSILVEIALWLLLIVPGVIYSVWRMASRYTACPQCKSQTMIPLDSPIGKKLLAEQEQVVTKEN
ncbi:MAG: hypothetical protein US63_C0008G0019 [Candidatus Moranbacteria bacterium GW2011_GWC2_37_8]|nr:MAG: hypothetical protein US63_C0008G0019 [Candidatus Moranbacteria bacterium GW2011_GWC2_37_8]KKQ62400.1 MAG: hypothetical protein US82_C0012G0018 [Parcubacteria group bacterium GW2011_GWC1_38_22]